MSDIGTYAHVGNCSCLLIHNVPYQGHEHQVVAEGNIFAVFWILGSVGGHNRWDNAPRTPPAVATPTHGVPRRRRASVGDAHTLG